jgi:hypothetical protein
MRFGTGVHQNELEKYIKHYDKALAARIVGVEAVDHPTDGQLLKLARKYFAAGNRLH